MTITADGFIFDAICFGGGSLQTACYIAEMAALERAINGPVSTRVKHFAGSSAGVMFAIGFAAGGTALDGGDLIERMAPHMFAPNIATLWHAHALDDGTLLEKSLREHMLGTLGVDMDQPIKAFEETHGVTLDVYAVDAGQRRGMCMPKHATLMQAFRCSAAIPLIFPPAFFEDRLYMDGAFGNCWIPHTLNRCHRWLWLRAQQPAPGSSDSLFTPDMFKDYKGFEAYMSVIISVVRAPADVVVDMPTNMRAFDITPDACVPFLVPRMSAVAVREMRRRSCMLPGTITFRVE